MGKFNAADTLKKAEADGLLGKSDYLKIQEGENRIRLLSDPVAYQSEFKGKFNTKFVAWVLDRRDGQVKAYFMPATVLEGIGALQSNPDYAFEEVPMPFDITVVAKGAGTKEVKYSVLGARTNTPLTEVELKALEAKGTIQDYLKEVEEVKQSGGTSEKAVEQTLGVDEIENDPETPFD
ncbi:MAG: hypothetical protein AB1757_06720 [Acidobacteriota bacterium]